MFWIPYRSLIVEAYVQTKGEFFMVHDALNRSIVPNIPQPEQGQTCVQVMWKAAYWDKLQLVKATKNYYRDTLSEISLILTRILFYINWGCWVIKVVSYMEYERPGWDSDNSHTIDLWTPGKSMARL